MQAFRSSLVAAAIALALAGPAAAQETTTEPAEPAPEAEAPETGAPAAEPTETPATEPADAPPAPDTPAEAPADAEPEAADGTASGDPARREVMEIVRDTFGDWEVRCLPDGSNCFMYQLARDSKENPVAEVNVQKLPEGAEAPAALTVATPLGTLLPAGVVLQVDDGERRRYEFALCSQVACFSRSGLEDTQIAAMKRGKAGKITLVSFAAPDRPLVLDMSLSGFTMAFDSLEVPEMPAPAAAPATPAEPAAPLAPAGPAAPLAPAN